MPALRRRGAALADIEAVYRLRFSEFCAVAAVVLHDREAARDAVQDAFAKAVRGRRSFRGEGSLEGWLRRTVVNTALTERRRAIAGTSSARARHMVPSSNGAHATDDVRAAIELLPERQRLVVFLRYWADLDYLAIAEALSISPGTVAATLHAAHRSVRNQLQEVHT